MSNFKIFLTRNFWIKLIVISLWSIVIGTYLWFLSYAPNCPMFDKWLSVVGSTLIGGIGMNHITNLYNIPTKDFDIKLTLPVLFISGGAILLIMGVLLGALYKEHWAQIVAVIYIILAMFIMVSRAE